MKTPKSLVEINGQLVSVTVDYIHPPVPSRDWDWVAYYSDDQSDNPDCGWGATADLAIQDLTDNYEDPE